MKTKQFRHAAQPLDVKVVREIVKEGSKTIPDQAMSVREILHRYTSGQSLDVNNHTPVYLENVPLYDTRRKNNIDIAVDRLKHEEQLYNLEKKVYDNKTALRQLDADVKDFENAKPNKNSDENPSE